MTDADLAAFCLESALTALRRAAKCDELDDVDAAIGEVEDLRTELGEEAGI
jgi:hypothetical protein